jgi:restriction system protein
MNKVIDPVVRQIGPKEYSLYEAMRPAILLTIAGFVEQQVGSSESFTLGPNLSPADYEQYCAGQLRLAGWSADTTKASGDQGTDIIAQKGDLRLVVQCKLYNHPVGNKAVQEITAARTHERADCAAVVSNSRYTSSAQQLAATNGVLLLHHSDLRSIDDLLAI